MKKYHKANEKLHVVFFFNLYNRWVANILLYGECLGTENKKIKALREKRQWQFHR